MATPVPGTHGSNSSTGCNASPVTTQKPSRWQAGGRRSQTSGAESQVCLGWGLQPPCKPLCPANSHTLQTAVPCKLLHPENPCTLQRPAPPIPLCPANPCILQTHVLQTRVLQMPASCKPLPSANPNPLHSTACCKLLPPASLCTARSVTLCSPSTPERELSTAARAAQPQGLAGCSLLRLGAASRPELLTGTRQQKLTGLKGQCPYCPSQDLRWCQLLLTMPHANCQN